MRHDKNYVKLRQVLQIAMVIAKCDVSKHAFDHECWEHYQKYMFKISGRPKSFNELCIKSRALIQLHCILSTYRGKWVARNKGNNKNRATGESPADVPILVYEEYYASYCMWSWWVTAALLQVITYFIKIPFLFFPETWYEWKGKDESFLSDFNSRC